MTLKEFVIDQLDSNQEDSATMVDGHANPVNHAVTESRNDVFNIFKFAADNSDVEWSMDGYDIEGASTYVIGTQHSDWQALKTKRKWKIRKVDFLL